MWYKYANNGNGFCVVYEINDIINAYRKEILLKHNPRYLFRLCDYSKTLKIDLSKFTNDIEIITKKFKLKEDIDYEINNHIKNGDWKFILNVMFHKTGNFIEKNEFRLITKRQEDSKIPYDDVLKVKPRKIIISTKLDKIIIGFIEGICYKKCIPIEYYNC